MALTKSIQKAQIPLPCELCEIETKIKWKCTDCNLLMCDKCKNKVHSKFKKAKEHKIITIKEVGLHGDDSGQKLDFSDIQCKDHSGQVCCLFCKTCDHLVCPTGVTQNHKQHELLEIEKAFRMRMELLKKRKEKLEHQHDDLIKNKDFLNALKEKNKLSIDQNQKDIIKQKQVWKEAGEKYGGELGSEIDKQWRRKEEAIETESSKVKYFEQHLTDKLRLIEDMSISKDVTKFFKDTKSLEDAKEMLNVNLNLSQLKSFVPGKTLQSYFGSFQYKVYKEAKIIRIKAIKEYTTDLSVVATISKCSMNTFWILDPNDPKTVEKVTLTPEGTIQVLSTVKDNVYRTALTDEGSLLISDLTSNLKIQKGNGNQLIYSKYNFFPYITMPIYISEEHKLIVGAVKKLPIDYSVPGGGVVMVMDMDGNHEAKYEFGEHNEPLLTNPLDLTTTKNGNIFIIDLITEDSAGRIVILKNGTLENIYTGHPDVNCKNHPFKPQCIATSPSSNVIISDMTNNTLHFLDHSGHILAYCNTVEDEILLPCAMLCSKPGKLYIGSSIPLIGNHKAKIYEVEIPNNL